MTSPAALPRVTVSANAQGAALPDSFVITARVAAHAGDTAKAAKTLITRYAQLEAAVARLPASVEIGHGPMTNWPDGAKRSNWHAERTMTLTGADLALVGEVANTVAAVPDVALDGPHWRLGPDAAVHAELQGRVVHEARTRAERYAATLGGVLGRLVELRDEGGSHFHMQTASMDSWRGGGPPDVASLDLTPQQVEVHAAVTATWYLVLPE
ncbi:MAG: uncharacterized protein QOC66_341 [Pseudonocardiales bacterium]|jgi:uncharacterized protein YggE|nr:uncharacterized protein [Pseudonocardiales bacterium]